MSNKEYNLAKLLKRIKKLENNIDGEWTISNMTLLAYTSNNLPQDFDVTYDLSNYLPDDGNIYECIINGYIETLASNRICSISVGKVINGESCGAGGMFLKCGGTVSISYAHGTMPVLVFANRKLTIFQAGAVSTGAGGFSLLRYRKVR